MLSIHRLLWKCIAVASGLIGVAAAIESASVVSTALVFAILAFVLGLLSAIMQSLDSSGRRDRPIAASTVLRHGATAGFAAAAFYGLTDMAGSAVLPLTLLLVVTSPTVVDRWRAGSTRTDPRHR